MFEMSAAAEVAGPGACLGVGLASGTRPRAWLMVWAVVVTSWANRRRISLTDKGTSRGPVAGAGRVRGGDHGEDGVGEHDQGGVPVPGVQRRTWCWSSPVAFLAV